MAMSRMTEQIGRVLGGRYRLLSPLGSGASAEVYLAEDVRLRRQVAVKVLHPALADDASFLRRFRAEAQSAASLSHPHLLAVYDWSGDDGDTPFLVTEYLSGGSLRGLLDAGHRLSPAQGLVVGLEAARALDHAHRQGFVHRDIKPANLLFGDDARLRVADFGLARAIAEAGWTEPAGAVLGTARYASPEQARGEPVDGRSDVYSLALVVIESVTGQVPFTADTTIGMLMARLDRSVEVPDELGPLAPVLARAGALDPAERLDAAAFGHALVGAAPELDRPAPLPLVGVEPPSVTPPPPADPTLLGPAAQAAAVRAAAAAPAPAAPVFNGSATTQITRVGPDATSLMAPPPAAPPGVRPLHQGDHAAGLSPGDRSARRLMVGAAVVLLAAVVGVVGGWYYMQSQLPSYPVPATLVGLQRSALPAEIDEFGWKIEDVEEYRDNTEPGQILATRPAAGEELREGSTLTVVVSRGPTPVDLPADLVGMTQDEAREALEAVGLVAQFVPQVDRDVPEGQVIGFADGDPGPQVPKGSTVRLTVATDDLEMPDVEGRTFDEAVAELEGMGLVVEQATDEADDDHPVGTVVRTDPRAGRKVEAGDTVTVFVAADEAAEVPDVQGDDLDEATEEIEDAGLVVGQVTGPRGGVVMTTWPFPGSQVAGGSAVDLVMLPGD